MKKLILVILVALAVTSVAMAQTPPPYKAGADVLGAHNGYGRGCVMCHAPHSGALGNGVGTTTDPQNGMYALWGQNLTPLFGKTYDFSGDGGTTYNVTLPASGSIASAFDANTIILLCLSCHDGNLAKVGMMEGQTVEALPIVGGTAPTLLAKTGVAPSGGTPYQNDHPVGQYAVVGCGGGHNWDCVGGSGNTPIYMTGTASGEFLGNYQGSFWNNWNSQVSTYVFAVNSDQAAGGKGCLSSTGKPTACVSNPLASFGGVTVNAVTCTTCHNQHSMTVYTNSLKTLQPCSSFVGSTLRIPTAIRWRNSAATAMAASRTK